ncbi:MAG: type II toxin-antitoxin system HicB family antitoxin [Gammaproteobacteria bacterium]|nr:type II toxin-antitoxin system HicB family antitoxin [Gammaproteobacteria bacterium]
MNLMKIDKHTALISYDEEIDTFRGEILGLSGGADFYGTTPQELKREFATSLKVYLETCAEKGIEPYKNFSGKTNLRMGVGMHKAAAYLAASKGISLNDLILGALAHEMEENNHTNDDCYPNALIK